MKPCSREGKVFLNGEKGRQLSSVISDSSRGKNDIEKLGLEFPYCHPVSLYVELFGAAAAESGDLVLDHFAGSGYHRPRGYKPQPRRW